MMRDQAIIKMRYSKQNLEKDLYKVDFNESLKDIDLSFIAKIIQETL